MDLAHGALVVALLAIISITTSFNKKKARRNLPLPPGPRPLPILGNLHRMNTVFPWITYKEWSDIYGDIIYSRILNQDVIILNSEKVARALLEKRSGNYSDRPRFATMELQVIRCMLFKPTHTICLKGYGDAWRRHRRIYHQAFRPEAAVIYRPMQLRKAHQLLLNLFHDPAKYEMHLETHSASIVMSAVYDYDTKPDDPLVSMIQGAMHRIIHAETPEKAAIIDSYPALTLIPAWFPGASFKRHALELKSVLKDMVEKPFEYAIDRISSGLSSPSMVSEGLARFQGDPSFELAIKESSATAFGAGSETTHSVVLVFVQAMVLNPEVQKRAQAEIDRVVTADRLPDFGDRDSMPYIEAILRETLRFYPIVPLGVPHAAVNDDVYDGYFIPKGTSILTNVWAMTHDATKYPAPFEFKPERFFTPSGDLNDDHVTPVWGWGRRICVGRYVADATLWSAIASTLAVFDFLKATDANGKDINFEPRWTSGIMSRPVSFPCRIVPRRRDMDVEKLTSLISATA
ncbi:cytochrome P450 [Suillus clintonianus]|uniref:cytochrome P450 n=1 Tax=Suillus clintonianus TaxID=1904413 RepID=UPI001B85B751|nr:cytochrome P450 [Suillus clintonianus]KAG2117750.1 cytochrome P450 [Suillus clintonianus]